MVTILILSAAAASAGCGNRAVVTPQTISEEEVKTTYDPQFEFPRRGSYIFLHISGEIETYTPEALARMDRIDDVFQDALEERGFRLGDPAEGVDFFVDYHMLFQQTVYMLTERGEGTVGEWARVVRVPEDFVTGALMLEITDARTGNLVWRGIWNANITLEEISDADKEGRIDYAVRQLVRTFPPRP